MLVSLTNYFFLSTVMTASTVIVIYPSWTDSWLREGGVRVGEGLGAGVEFGRKNREHEQ